MPGRKPLTPIESIIIDRFSNSLNEVYSIIQKLEEYDSEPINDGPTITRYEQRIMRWNLDHSFDIPFLADHCELCNKNITDDEIVYGIHLNDNAENKVFCCNKCHRRLKDFKNYIQHY